MSATLNDASNLSITIGPVLLVNCFNLITIGVAYAQTVKYFSRYIQSWRHAYIGLLNVWITGFAATTIGITWSMAVKQDYIEQLEASNALYTTQNFFCIMIFMWCMTFLSFRLYLLSGWRFFCSFLAMSDIGVSFMAIGTGYATAAGDHLPGVAGFDNATPFDVSSGYYAIALYVILVVDFGVGGGLVYQMLRRPRGSDPQRERMIQRISIITVAHCAIFAAFSVLTIIFLQVLPYSGLAYFFTYARAPIIASGVLHSFNVRSRLLDDWKRHHTRIINALPPSGTGNTDIALVEVTKSTETRIEQDDETESGAATMLHFPPGGKNGSSHTSDQESSSTPAGSWVDF